MSTGLIITIAIVVDVLLVFIYDSSFDSFATDGSLDESGFVRINYLPVMDLRSTHNAVYEFCNNKC